MKKFILATMIAAAAIFTACDDDSSSSTPVDSCDIEATVPLIEVSVHACIESSDMVNAEKVCKENLAEMIPGVTNLKFASGCPSGSKNSCKFEKDGAHLTVLVYDEFLSGLSCNDLLEFLE